MVLRAPWQIIELSRYYAKVRCP